VERDGLLFIPANYRTGDAARCGNTLHAVLDADGSIYVATGTLGAAFHAIGVPATYPEPACCARRMR
jgi:hypothetical protein